MPTENPKDREAEAIPFSLEFLLIEFFVFLSQVATLLIVAYTSTCLLTNEKLLAAFADARINTTTFTEFGLTIGALLFCLGVTALINHLLANPTANRIALSVMDELPRTIYFFGSTLAATTASLGIYLWSSSAASQGTGRSFVGYSLYFAMAFFAMGVFIRGQLIRARSRQYTAPPPSA